MEADELEASPPFPLFLDRERNKWLLVRNERERKGKKIEFIERDWLGIELNILFSFIIIIIIVTVEFEREREPQEKREISGKLEREEIT